MNHKTLAITSLVVILFVGKNIGLITYGKQIPGPQGLPGPTGDELLFGWGQFIGSLATAGALIVLVVQTHLNKKTDTPNKVSGRPSTTANRR